jgi:putative tryptophan/tyrosine transport system substrate-binding protein
MRRRAFIAGLSSGVARWLLSAMPAVAQQKIARIGVLTPGGSDRTPSVEAFRKRLQELGYIEGRSIILDFRFATGPNDALLRLAAELVKIPVDVIVGGEQPRCEPQQRLRAVSQSFRRRVVTRSPLV